MAVGGRDHLVTRCLAPEERESNHTMTWENYSSVTRLQIRGISPVRKRYKNSPKTCLCKLAHSLLFLLRVLILNALLHVCDLNVLLFTLASCVCDRTTRTCRRCYLRTRSEGARRHESFGASSASCGAHCPVRMIQCAWEERERSGISTHMPKTYVLLNKALTLTLEC